MAPHDALAPDAGVAAAVELVLARPARLGATRLVAVDGPSGSGKTTFAAPLAAAVAEAIGGSVMVPARRSRATGCGAPPPAGETGSAPGSGIAIESGDAGGFGSTQGPGSESGLPLVAVVSTDLLATWEQPLEWWPVLEEHLLAPIARGETAVLPVVEWVSGNPRPGGSIEVPPVDVLVLEGVSSGRRAVADRLTVLVWVEVADAPQRLERAVARDGEGMRRFLARWQRDEALHFERDDTAARADVVIHP